MRRKLFEAKQKPLVVYNPADIFMKYNMKPGDYVSIAYITDVLQGGSDNPIARKGSQKTCYNINPETDAQLVQYIDELPNNKIKQLLTEFRESKKYQDFLNGTSKLKSCKLNLTTEHIIKVSHLTCNWKDSKALAKFYEKQREDILKLRQEYGFDDGFDNNYERFYPEEKPEKPIPIDDRTEEEKENDKSWRDNHGFRNIIPRGKSGYNGNIYNINTILPGIYSSFSNPDNVVFRFAYNKRSSHKESDYYYVNGDGTLLPLNKAFITFLTYAYKKNKEEEIYPTQEEREFVMKLKQITDDAPSTAEMTLSCNSVLFMKSTARTSKNAKVSENIPFVWINTKAVVDKYDFINPNDLNTIIKNLVYSLDDTDVNGTIENINVKGKSISDLVYTTNGKVTADPAEVRKRLGITEALRCIAYKYITEKKKKALYESIINKVAKAVKRKIQLI